MPLPRRRRTDFNPTPLSGLDLTALKAAAQTLPDAPGVYIFHGEDGDLPLYIGKSIHLRQRVLSHLRNPDEARMLQQTRRISHIRTAGDLGAQLLEAQMIKQHLPLMNQKLRRNRQLCAWRLSAGQPELVHAQALDFAITPELFGLYTSRHAALEALHTLADSHGLCHGALGLERLNGGRPCFRALLHKCKGWCQGRESTADHHTRLRQAMAHLQVACWPHPGAIGLVETGADMCQIHVVRNWCYLGSVSQPHEADRLQTVAAGFDADGYRILCGPLLSGDLPHVALPLSSAAAARRADCETPASPRPAGRADAKPPAPRRRSVAAGSRPGR